MRKILIANRGEIACRIARTGRRMGLGVATVHSSADADALHVREVGESVLIGDAAARSSYLDIAAVVAAARRVGADAVHPGFGFLSENPAFARACADAGLTFIGPAPDTLALFGDKAAAKRLAGALGIPTAGGLDTPDDDVEALLAAIADLPRPFILKAVAGGGGKGMRVVREGEDPREAIAAAIREGRSAFGDGRLIAERYLAAPRHIEVQILGDGQGGVIHLYDRECSLQRRYQKVVEEAPVSSLAQVLREQLWRQAVALGEATRYLGLGTVEFAVTGDAAVFLEVNPRLQVEHPVTEAVLGLDLVRLQIEAVAARQLPFAQDAVPRPRGAAVQARLYAEDAARGFLPATGRVTVFEAAPGARIDAGLDAGCEITPHYDPMVAKVIAHGDTRTEALSQLRAALAATAVLGVTTNRGFLLALLADPQVQGNAVSTEFIDRWLQAQPLPEMSTERVAAALALWLARQRAAHPDAGAWHDAALTGWRMARGPLPPRAATHRATASGAAWDCSFAAHSRGGLEVQVGAQRHHVETAARCGDGGAWQSATVDGMSFRLRAAAGPGRIDVLFDDGGLALEIAPLHANGGQAVGAGHGLVRAPMMGLIVAVDVTAGQEVTAGQRLGTMESMKMEMALTAPVAGRVASVACAPQSRVERHQELFRIDAA